MIVLPSQIKDDSVGNGEGGLLSTLKVKEIGFAENRMVA